MPAAPPFMTTVLPFMTAVPLFVECCADVYGCSASICGRSALDSCRCGCVADMLPVPLLFTAALALLVLAVRWLVGSRFPGLTSRIVFRTFRSCHSVLCVGTQYASAATSPTA
eukprot:2054716-Rhodomonas_salina.3